MTRSVTKSRWSRRWMVVSPAVLLITGATAFAMVTNLTEVDLVHDPAAVHVDQQHLKAQQALIAFLENLVLFKLEEEEEEASGALTALGQLAGGPRQPRVKIGPKGFRIVARD